MTDLDRVRSLLARCSLEERGQVFSDLRREFSIHPLEADLHAKAEIILEAIRRAGGLTLRMIRGVIAEAAFDVEVVERLANWEKVPQPTGLAYDFLLRDLA
jgi:hypothetical protein